MRDGRRQRGERVRLVDRNVGVAVFRVGGTMRSRQLEKRRTRKLVKGRVTRRKG